MTLLLALLMHLQAVYLIPGLVLIVSAKYRGESDRLHFRRADFIVAGALAVIGGSAYVYLYQTDLTFEIMFLPPFVGRPHYPSYAMFSAEHWLDMLNLVLVTAPGAFILLTTFRWRTFLRNLDLLDQFLLVTGSFAAIFLLVVDPRLGIGRDWDLLAFTVIPWLLLISRNQIAWQPKQILAYSITLLVITLAFTATNLYRPAAEERYLALLENYGAKNRAGWVILANYYSKQRKTAKSTKITARMSTVFPQDEVLERAYAALESGDVDEAHRLADSLHRVDKFNADYMQILGNTEGKLGNVERAVDLCEDAISLKPFNTLLRNEYCQLFLNHNQLDRALECFKELRDFDPHTTQVAEGLALTYIRAQDYPSALAIADSLMSVDPQSPGACLIRMTVAVHRGNLALARKNYLAYLDRGTGRSDYTAIRDYYSYLIH